MNSVLSRAIQRINESVAIALFGDGYLEKARIAAVLITRNNQKVFPVTFRFCHNKVSFVLTFYSHSDLMLFHEIFCGHLYRISLKEQPEYIVDLGANIGISTLYLHTCYPHARIVAVEANTELATRFHEVMKDVHDITLVPYAVGNHDGEALFYINESNALGSSLRARTTGTKQVSVPVRTLHSLTIEVGFPRIDLIKFDIEGAEYEVFAAYPKRQDIRAIVGEVHEDLMGTTLDTFKHLWEGMALTLIPTKKKGRYNIYGIRS